MSHFRNAIALSNLDYKLLESFGIPNVSCIPVMVGIPENSSECAGAPCMAFGPNFLNLQGFLHFRDIVLPLVLEENHNFTVDVFGRLPRVEEIVVPAQIKMRGFVKVFGDAMLAAGFFVNPTYSGTGMQIKTIEAMSWGLAPVLYASVAESAGIRHLETGWVANTPEDFANGLIELSRDRGLARRLGQNARKLVAAQSSEAELDRRMEAFMGRLIR